MKAQREYGLALSWPRVTAVFLIDVALLVIASHLPRCLGRPVIRPSGWASVSRRS